MDWLEDYQPLVGVRLNMVASSDGKFIGPQGSSREISNSFDREVIIRLRSLSDVYVTGGNTFRSEHYKVPNSKALAVITNNPAVLDKAVIALGPYSDFQPAEVISELQSLGYRKILLEVGPTLAGKFLKSDCVDEFCLSVPLGTQENATATVRELGSRLKLISSRDVEGTLFTRWRRGN